MYEKIDLKKENQIKNVPNIVKRYCNISCRHNDNNQRRKKTSGEKNNKKKVGARMLENEVYRKRSNNEIMKELIE